MLSRLQNFFNFYLGDDADDSTTLDHKLQLAAAALMVEMSHADDNVSPEEEIKIQQLLDDRFQLSASEIESLVELAHGKKHEATDYYEFTSLLNQHYTQAQKIKLVEDLWSVAFSDKHLDKFEEHLLRRLAELLHVPHQDFIRTKHRVLEQAKEP